MTESTTSSPHDAVFKTFMKPHGIFSKYIYQNH